MSRRSSLPGAAELFRPTDEPAAVPVAPVAQPAADQVGLPVRHLSPVPESSDGAGQVVERQVAERQVVERRSVERQPSGRERHDEKITVYVSQDELVDLEQARLTLRAVHGLAVDRGRIVREALAVVLADLDAQGATSTLVRRLTGV